MAALAIPLGPLLRSMPPLEAYGWDIAGSMLGIAAFTTLSAAGTPPFVWFVVAVVLVTLLLAGTDSGGLVLLRLAGTAGLAVVLLLTFGPEARTRSGRRTTGSTPTSSATARCT